MTFIDRQGSDQLGLLFAVALAGDPDENLRPCPCRLHVENSRGSRNESVCSTLFAGVTARQNAYGLHHMEASSDDVWMNRVARGKPALPTDMIELGE